jgi:hypothetical protein
MHTDIQLRIIIKEAKSFTLSQKVKQLLYELTIPFLGIYPREVKTRTKQILMSQCSSQQCS